MGSDYGWNGNLPGVAMGCTDVARTRRSQGFALLRTRHKKQKPRQL